MKKYLELKFEVIKTADNSRYAKGVDINLINLSPIAIFNNRKLRKASAKNLEDVSHAHIVSLLYKLPTSTRGSDDMSIGFDRDHIGRQRELTNNKNIKGI